MGLKRTLVLWPCVVMWGIELLYLSTKRKGERGVKGSEEGKMIASLGQGGCDNWRELWLPSALWGSSCLDRIFGDKDWLLRQMWNGIYCHYYYETFSEFKAGWRIRSDRTQEDWEVGALAGRHWLACWLAWHQRFSPRSICSMLGIPEEGPAGWA